MLSIAEHRVINNFMYTFLKVNLNFKQNYEKKFFFDVKNTFNRLTKGSIICPNPITVYSLVALVRHGKVFTQHAKYNLDNYVSFTRVNFVPVVKTWCDWCAIVNGYYFFLIQAINDYYAENSLASISKKQLNALKFYISKAQLYKIVIGKEAEFSTKVALSPTKLFPNIYHQAPAYVKKLLELVIRAYQVFEAIERQWCPFQHMKKIALLSDKDKARYASYLKCENFQDLIKAGEILLAYKHIKCSDCVYILNKHLTIDKVNVVTNVDNAYQQFLALLSNISQSK